MPSMKMGMVIAGACACMAMLSMTVIIMNRRDPRRARKR